MKHNSSSSSKVERAASERQEVAGQYRIAVAIAPDGTVFAVDYGNSRIQKWRPKRGD